MRTRSVITATARAVLHLVAPIRAALHAREGRSITNHSRPAHMECGVWGVCQPTVVRAESSHDRAVVLTTKSYVPSTLPVRQLHPSLRDQPTCEIGYTPTG
jgi:hypothetical protein